MEKKTKELYEVPEVEIVEFGYEDIIRTSENKDNDQTEWAPLA